MENLTAGEVLFIFAVWVIIGVIIGLSMAIKQIRSSLESFRKVIRRDRQ